MTRGIWLSAAVFAMLASPAFAQDRCSAPIAPVVPDGKTSTAAELGQVAKDVVAFIRASDEYQNCLLSDIQAQETAARQAKKRFDPAATVAKGDANQKEKERIGAAYNAAAAAYKAAHPQ